MAYPAPRKHSTVPEARALPPVLISVLVGLAVLVPILLYGLWRATQGHLDTWLFFIPGVAFPLGVGVALVIAALRNRRS